DPLAYSRASGSVFERCVALRNVSLRKLGSPAFRCLREAEPVAAGGLSPGGSSPSWFASSCFLTLARYSSRQMGGWIASQLLVAARALTSVPSTAQTSADTRPASTHARTTWRITSAKTPALPHRWRVLTNVVRSGTGS